MSRRHYTRCHSFWLGWGLCRSEQLQPTAFFCLDAVDEQEDYNHKKP
jgi:hypothetical protein